LFPGLAGNYTVNGQSVPLTATQAFYRRVARTFVNNDMKLARIDGRNTTDWTFVQEIFDDASIVGPSAFYHPQFAALAAFSTIGSSDYHGATFTLRHRLKNDLLFDFNYTFSKSFDDSSSLEAQVATATLIRNPLNLKLGRAVSNFDVQHSMNANWLASLPFGKGKMLLGNVNRGVDAIVGGWQLSGIFRWHTGLSV